VTDTLTAAYAMPGMTAATIDPMYSTILSAGCEVAARRAVIREGGQWYLDGVSRESLIDDTGVYTIEYRRLRRR